MVISTATVAFFTDLRILSNLLSISTLFIFMLVAVGILVRRYYSTGITTKENQIKLIVCVVLIIGSSCGMSGYRAMSDGWIGWAVTVPLWLLGTGGVWFLVPEAKKPKVWGVPLVPWLPSFSIAINIFLLGSIDKDSYIRFGIWSGILLIYYFLIGLHASYDASKEVESRHCMAQYVDKEINKVVEEECKN
jgi:APA family basic amino acid/polyamine antiporter